MAGIARWPARRYRGTDATDAFEVALEAAAIGVVFTWATIFLCQLRLRRLTDAERDYLAQWKND